MLNVDDSEKAAFSAIKGIVNALLPWVLLLGCGSICDAGAIFIVVKLQVAFNRTNPNGYKKVNVGAAGIPGKTHRVIKLASPLANERIFTSRVSTLSQNSIPLSSL